MQDPPAVCDRARNVERALTPKSIAVVGASTDPRSFAYSVLQNIEHFGYQGSIHLVSRSSKQINSHPCVGSIGELPSGIDLAVLCIPQSGVLEAVIELGKIGAGAAVIFASGYSEAGEAGQAAQQALTQAAKQAQLILVGPNCMGVTNFLADFSVSFETIPHINPGKRKAVGIVAQSGAMASNIREALLGRGLLISAVVSTGNEANRSIEDYMAWFIAQEQTSAIAIYAEQIRRPQLFLELARRALQAHKPIVMVMPGKSAKARVSAQSHTAALADDHALVSALMEREGICVVDTLDELFDVTTVLARYPTACAGGTAILTSSGAIKNIAFDFAQDIGLQLPELTDETLKKLTQLLPSYALADNPLDYTTLGIRSPSLVIELIETVLNDPKIGNIICAGMAGSPNVQQDKADYLVPTLERSLKPALLTILGDDGYRLEQNFERAISASGIPLFRSPYRAMRACYYLNSFSHSIERCKRSSGSIGALIPLAHPPAANGLLAEYQGKSWLSALGIAVPKARLAQNLEAAQAIAGEIGYPIVLKAQSALLPHKSDVGGVIVGVNDAQALVDAWTRLHTNIAARHPDLSLDGVLIEAMCPSGLELAVGSKRNAQWGPVLMVGLGGIFIEALNDVRLMAADLSQEDIVSELQQLKCAALLGGTRGRPGVDIQAIATVLTKIGRQMCANPSITEIDINPLVAYPHGALALDCLIGCSSAAHDA